MIKLRIRERIHSLKSHSQREEESFRIPSRVLCHQEVVEGTCGIDSATGWARARTRDAGGGFISSQTRKDVQPWEDPYRLPGTIPFFIMRKLRFWEGQGVSWQCHSYAPWSQADLGLNSTSVPYILGIPLSSSECLQRELSSCSTAIDTHGWVKGPEEIPGSSGASDQSLPSFSYWMEMEFIKTPSPLLLWSGIVIPALWDGGILLYHLLLAMASGSPCSRLFGKHNHVSPGRLASLSPPSVGWRRPLTPASPLLPPLFQIASCTLPQRSRVR